MAPRDRPGRHRRGAGRRALKRGAPGPSRRRIALLGTLFACLVGAIALHAHALFLPITLGLLAWAKQTLLGWAKLLTPKLALALAKNGAVIKARDLVVGSSTQLLVMSHRPWRRRLLGLKLALGRTSGRIGRALLRRWLAAPLWVRCLIAALVLGATASSAWAVLALLIVPQPIVEFLKARALAFLNKLGVLRGLDVAWRRLVPTGPRERVDRWRRWTLGRRQVRASREVRARVAAAAAAARPAAVPFAAVRARMPAARARERDEGEAR